LTRLGPSWGTSHRIQLHITPRWIL